MSILAGMIPELPVILQPNSAPNNVITNGFQYFKGKLTIYLNDLRYPSFLTTGAFHDQALPKSRMTVTTRETGAASSYGRLMWQNASST